MREPDAINSAFQPSREGNKSPEQGRECGEAGEGEGRVGSRRGRCRGERGEEATNEEAVKLRGPALGHWLSHPLAQGDEASLGTLAQAV